MIAPRLYVFFKGSGLKFVLYSTVATLVFVASILVHKPAIVEGPEPEPQVTERKKPVSRDAIPDDAPKPANAQRPEPEPRIDERKKPVSRSATRGETRKPTGAQRQQPEPQVNERERSVPLSTIRRDNDEQRNPWLQQDIDGQEFPADDSLFEGFDQNGSDGDSLFEGFGGKGQKTDSLFEGFGDEGSDNVGAWFGTKSE